MRSFAGGRGTPGFVGFGAELVDDHLRHDRTTEERASDEAIVSGAIRAVDCDEVSTSRRESLSRRWRCKRVTMSREQLPKISAV